MTFLVVTAEGRKVVRAAGELRLSDNVVSRGHDNSHGHEKESAK